jgi:hypothetical protein
MGADTAPNAGETAQEAAPAVDLSPLTGQLEAVAQQQEELRQALLSMNQQPPEPEPDPLAELDFSFLDPQEPTYDPQEFQQQLQPAIHQLAPIQEQLREQQYAQQAQQLVEEFPEMGQQEVAEAVCNFSEQIVQSEGWPPELATHPAMLRLVFMAGRAAEAAQQEGAAPAPAHLQAPSGNVPGSGPQDPGDAIIGAAGQRGRNALPF